MLLNLAPLVAGIGCLDNVFLSHHGFQWKIGKRGGKLIGIYIMWIYADLL